MPSPRVGPRPDLAGRRRFLQAGLAGAVLLSLLPRQMRSAGTARRANALTAEHRIVLAAVAPVMLADALPAGTQRAQAVRDVVDGVEQAIRALPPHLQAEVGQLFSLLTFAPARVLLARVSRPWSEASAEDIASFLDSWRTSWFALLRSAYQALHELIMAGWYARPESWIALRYPGPPRIG